MLKANVQRLVENHLRDAELKLLSK